MGIFGNAFTGWHLLVIVFLVLLLFGAPKLPALAKSVGQSMKILKSEIKTDKTDKPDATAEAPTVTTVTPAETTATTTDSSAGVNPTPGTPGSQTKP